MFLINIGDAMADVVKMFDNMNDEYDVIKDPWYSWFFTRMHYFIAKYIIEPYDLENVLDVGCGTGFQSFLHAAAGSSVIGFDISPALIAVANEKKDYFDYIKVELFPAYFDFVERYNRIIRKIVIKRRGTRKYAPPIFEVADAENIPYDDEEFDHINCCGSVLSFVPRYKRAIAEISRVLKNNRTFFIEVENRWRFETFWTCLDPLIKGKLGINNDIKNGIKLITKNPMREAVVDFNTVKKGVPINLNLNLFTTYSLTRELHRHGLIVDKIRSIHSITNVIPYPVLYSLELSKRLLKFFFFLARIEESLPFYSLGYNSVFIGHKKR